MKSISFGHTWPALVARAKSVTRRQWKAAQAKTFHAGDQVLALDKDRRAGGQPIAELRLVDDVRSERLIDMPDSDYAAEGFSWFHAHEQAIPMSALGQPWAKDECSLGAYLVWRHTRPAQRVYVVRFTIERVYPAATRRLERILVGEASA